MKNILIVDDDVLIRETLRIGLTNCLDGCMLLTAGNGNQAVEILESLPVALILTDLKMPGMDGYELLETARKDHPEIPVLAMTGRCDSEVRERLAALGVFRCLQKPFELEDVASEIRCELSRAGAGAGVPATFIFPGPVAGRWGERSVTV